MITPKAFRQIIHHFDEIDKVVSLRSSRKRPWSEISLTSLLCELLDGETQKDWNLTYSFEELQEDLNQEDSLFGIHLSLETIEFSPSFERYVSQSDIGLKLIFENMIEPEFSWTRPYLLQAKRLYPKGINPLVYSEASRFESVDKDQHKRVELLNKVLGDTYVKYLLFCPRPESVDDDTRMKLAYLQNKYLSQHIFDYVLGLELHRESFKNNETLKAGIFITESDKSNINFGDVHGQILQSTFPLSWFIAINIAGSRDFLRLRGTSGKDQIETPSRGREIVEGILSGDKNTINDLISKTVGLDRNKVPENMQILPKHKITLRFSVGEQINSDMRGIRKE